MFSKQKGFTVVESLIVLAVLLIVGLAGYVMWQRSHTETKMAQTSTSTTQATEVLPTKPLPSAVGTFQVLYVNPSNANYIPPPTYVSGSATKSTADVVETTKMSWCTGVKDTTADLFNDAGVMTCLTPYDSVFSSTSTVLKGQLANLYPVRLYISNADLPANVKRPDSAHWLLFATVDLPKLDPSYQARHLGNDFYAYKTSDNYTKFFNVEPENILYYKLPNGTFAVLQYLTLKQLNQIGG